MGRIEGRAEGQDVTGLQPLWTIFLSGEWPCAGRKGMEREVAKAGLSGEAGPGLGLVCTEGGGWAGQPSLLCPPDSSLLPCPGQDEAPFLSLSPPESLLLTFSSGSRARVFLTWEFGA